MAGAFDPSFEALPATLPVFPLPGVLLLPGGRLPLNIFEPRYLVMTRDAIASDRLIGMIQPKHREAESEGLVEPLAELHPVGCAGRIIGFSETDDGRYFITLAGLIRFAVVREIPTVGGYRRVVPDFARFRADMDDRGDEGVADRGGLIAALKSFLAARQASVDWDALAKLSDDRLVTTLAMGCPFDAVSRQALLEAPDLAARAMAMRVLLEMGRETAPAGGSSARH